MTRIFCAALLLACVLTSIPSARAQGKPAAQGPDEVVRNFYAWYLGRLEKDDWTPLDNRREALKYLTPAWRVRAPRVSGDEGVNVFVCAQDWLAEWRKSMTFAPAVARGTQATARVTWGTGPDTQRINVTLKKVGGAWKIDRTSCAL
jgi:hypothetical protein